MNRKGLVVGGLAVIGLFIAVSAVRSDDTQKPGEAQMTPEQQKMMEAWTKAGTPGPEHQKMAKMVGKWKAEVKFWEGPGEPQISSGAAEFKLILGGRYIEETFHGEAMGMPFEGRGIHGFNNITGKHQSLWMDSMSTAIVMFEGAWDEQAKAVVTYAEELDPMGNKCKLRSVCPESDGQTATFQMYKQGPEGPEFKSLEITYTRVN